MRKREREKIVSDSSSLCYYCIMQINKWLLVPVHHFNDTSAIKEQRHLNKDNKERKGEDNIKKPRT